MNGEIWFPREFTVHVDGRLLLVKGFSGDARQSFSDYRKFTTTVTILPPSAVIGNGMDTVEPSPQPGPTTH